MLRCVLAMSRFSPIVVEDAEQAHWDDFADVVVFNREMVTTESDRAWRGAKGEPS